jgi:ABC-type multidrug transport system ATPase subunit
VIALDVRHVAKSYGRTPVLHDVSLRVGPGELVGIEGENGAGKSTLLAILVGLLAPNAGEVRVRGRIGFCPQEPQIFDALTVRENFRFFASAYGLASFEPAMQALLDRFRYGRYVDRRVAELSGGTKQKLNLSLALLHAPDVVVLDEPYTGFDWETYLCFWDLAARLRADGRSLVVVSHLLHERGNFDRVYDLDGGVLRCA